MLKLDQCASATESKKFKSSAWFDALTAEIQQICISNGWTLSVAESCTGGNLAARLTRLQGSSRYFLGSVVAYSNLIKQEVLGIRDAVLKEQGAVSAPVVKQMATGVLTITGSDFSLAATGIAGPEGGTPEKPVGTIWAAIATQNEKPLIWHFHLMGERQQIIDQTIDIILSRFLHTLQRKTQICKVQKESR